MRNKFLDLLWKCKPLFKLYVFLDYLFVVKRIPKTILLGKDRYFLKVNGDTLYFNPYNMLHYSIYDNIEYMSKPKKLIT
ncbi:hypothetical protein AS202_10350 [Myroides odoratimimus]|uniref:Uncharacterized protein n=1 Tax=Myroides odoratimimus TaxID=76832 RepID=A0AAI8C5H1_9FLAO|nr:hypothetical protein AS202_10350 [Myroides odoratimimus]